MTEPAPLVIAMLTPVYPSILMDTASTREEIISHWRKIAPAHWHLRPGLARCQPVSYCREKLTEWALKDHRTPTYRHPDAAPADVLVWLDSDVSLDRIRDFVDLVKLLVESPPDVAMVGAPVVIQAASTEGEQRPSWNVFVTGMPGGAEAAAQATEAQVETFECAGLGFGIVATRAEVYRQMARPWFRFEQFSDGRISGEDGLWCDAARALGYRHLCAPRIRARHHFIVANGLDMDMSWLPLRRRPTQPQEI